MSMEELKDLMPILVPVLGGVGAVLGLLTKVIWSHIEAKSEEIRRLTKENQELEGKATKLKEDTVDYKAERDEAVRRKDEADQRVAPLTIENANLQHRVKDLEGKVVEQKGRGDRYKATAEKLFGDVQAEQRKRKETETERDSTKNALTNAEARAIAAEQRAESTETKAVILQDERDTLDAIVTRLEKQIEGVTKQDGRVWNVPVGSDAPLFVPLSRRKAPVISVLNLKGGVGKTTITANLAGYLSSVAEKRVLMIDLDHQRSLTQLLLSTANRQSAANARHTVQDFLLNSQRSGTDLHAAAEKIPGLNRCSLVTNSDPELSHGAAKSLDDVEMSLLSNWLVKPNEGDARFLMRSALQSEVIGQEFDCVIIDCPPRLTTGCINALTASDFVLIPAQLEEVSIRSVPHLLTRLKILRDANVLSHLRILGIVANMVTANAKERGSAEAKLLRRIEASALEIWGHQVKGFKAMLRDSGFYLSATRELEQFDRLSLAVENNAIRLQYEPLFKEIQERIDESIGVAGVFA